MMRTNLTPIILCILFSCCSLQESTIEVRNRISIYETKSASTHNDGVPGSMGMPFPERTKELVDIGNGIILAKVDTLYIVGGDFLLDSTDVSKLFFTQEDTVSIGRSTNVFSESEPVVFYWPERKVFYEFADNASISFQLKAFSAMDRLRFNTGLRFYPATDANNNRIRFIPNEGENSSRLGMQGGTQEIMIKDEDSFIMTHEILHSVGICHEHSRQDRDNYVLVNTGNLTPVGLTQFEKFSYHGMPGTDVGPFDWNSIMLYGSYTENSEVVYDTSQPIVTKLNGDTFGCQRSYLSSWDIAGIRSIYGPPYHKLVISRDVTRDYTENSLEVYEAEVLVSVSFFSDEAMTIPAVLDIPRFISLQRTHRTCDVNHSILSQNSNRNYTIPAGVSSYEIERYTEREIDQYGMPYEVNFIDYTIRNSH